MNTPDNQSPATSQNLAETRTADAKGPALAEARQVQEKQQLSHIFKPVRFEMWAGQGWPKSWAEYLGIAEEKAVEIWPIIDRETCGPIRGEPQPDQWFAVAFDSTSQRTIWEALNARQAALTSGGATAHIEPSLSCDSTTKTS